MKIPSFFQSLLNFVMLRFSAGAHAALEAVSKVQISDDLQQAAHDAVVAAETTKGSGRDKFNAATSAVLADFAGVAIGAVHVAVQNAWAALYGKPDAPVPTAAPATEQPAT
jgi:hypothetical protein